MMVLPFFSVPEYVIFKNTTSHLGAQNAPNAWIMNLSFILIGAATIHEMWKALGAFWFQKIIISVFAIGLIMTGIFHHAPIVEGIPFSDFQDQMHSIFASIVGFSFTLFAISIAFIEEEKNRRIIAFIVCLGSMAISVLIFTVPDFAGIWQRIMFIGAFGWLIDYINRLKKAKA